MHLAPEEKYYLNVDKKRDVFGFTYYIGNVCFVVIKKQTF